MKISALVLMGLLFTILNCSGFADDYSWNNPSGGIFGDPNNWIPESVPELYDAALFTLPATYAVTLDGPRYNSRIGVDGSNVTLNLDGYEYFLVYSSEAGGRAAIVGEYGQGGLSVINGGVYSKDVSFGQFSDAVGSLIVSGSNTSWTAWQDDGWHGAWIGEDGDANLSILDNAWFRHGHGLSAFGENSNVVVDVNGLDSEWYVDGQFDMSVYGKTTVNITNGGRVRANLLNMADESGSSAQINIIGENQESELSLESSQEDSLTLGLHGAGVVHIEGSKLFNAGRMVIAAEPGSSGLLEVHEGSWVDCWGSVAIGGTFEKAGGVGHLSIIDDDRDNGFGIDFTPTSAEGQYMLVWPQGTITMDGGVIELEYDSWLANPIILQGGTLEGHGMIWAHVENHGGLVAPGDDQGWKLLEIGYNYTQDSNGTLKIEIGGRDMVSQHSQLQVNNSSNGYGVVSLDGMLDVTLTNDFVPGYDDEFTIISAGTINGTFSNAVTKYVFEDGSFDVIYNTDSVVLTHYSTEPACPKYPLADINKDCVVDLADFVIFASEWLNCNLVPESYCSGEPLIL
ncbi:MAG: hypothetical protein FJ263_03920 [Planctomycetes bacterium]|nr:hypothetical protein [Planctomycetota bacterium]